jgi:HSP20 family molecular chaperone IbpA
MRGTRLEMLHDHVRAIHRTITGSDPPDVPATEAPPPSLEEVEQHFAELEALARAQPFIAERVPPFSFAPPFDLYGTERELIIELGLPGVERGDLDVEAAEGALVITGARGFDLSEKRVCFHAEMPRGVFRRVVRLPDPVSGPPRVEVESGVVRVRLAKASRAPLPRA